jgi:hypothetical protein
MRTFATFLFALLLSTAIALLLNLVVLYAIHEFSFIPPMLVWTVTVAMISASPLGIGYAFAAEERTLGWIAIVLAAAVFVPYGVVPAVLAVAGGAEAQKAFLPIAFTFLVPTALTI